MAPSSIVATSLDLEYIFKYTTDDRSAPPSEHARDGICAKELDRRCNWSRLPYEIRMGSA